MLRLELLIPQLYNTLNGKYYFSLPAPLPENQFISLSLFLRLYTNSYKI